MNIRNILILNGVGDGVKDLKTPLRFPAPAFCTRFFTVVQNDNFSFEMPVS